MSKQPQNMIGHVFGDRYEIKRKLKQGGFASVYMAKDLKEKNKYVAVKVMDPKSKFYAEIEFKMYEKIKENNYTFGFVKNFQHGLQDGKYFIVMQLLDKDLDELILLPKTQSFSLKTVLMIGLQVIDRLQALHKIGYLHRDIKPDNLVIGFQEKNKIVYLIDFGLAKKIEEVRSEEKNKLMGSLGFMSCRAHQGKQTGISDDIESLIYTMLFLLNGSLPWSKIHIKNIAQAHQILIMKKKLSKSDFKEKNIPQTFFQILDKMKSTSINQKVDYLKIKYQLLETLKGIKQENDFNFDWVGMKSNSPEQRKTKKQISPQKIQKQNEKEKNQREIQNDIYEVYKFLDKSEQKKQNIGEKGKQQMGNKKKIEGNKAKKQQRVNNKIQISQKSNKKNQKSIRPSSAINNKNIMQKKPSFNAFNKITQLYGAIKYQGPNIAINKTAKHKI